MAALTLKYTPPGASLTTKAVSVLSVRGFDNPDDVELFPHLQDVALDGTMVEYVNSFRRRITIDFGVLSAKQDRVDLLNFCLDTSRKLSYGTETDIPVVLDDPSQFTLAWLGDFEGARGAVITFREKSVRTTFP